MTTPALDELRTLPQWVAFRLIPSQKRPGKTDKIPVNPHNGKNASVTNPETWGTYDQAIDRACSDELGGVGFVFTSSDPYIGIDLDGCIEGGELEPWALAIIERLASYTETSPSGTGVHIITRGELPAGGNRKGQIELYATGRFLTWTGKVYDAFSVIEERSTAIRALHGELFPSIPVTPAPVIVAGQTDNELVTRAMAARDGASFSQLWHGDVTGYVSPSEADLALANKLAFWAGPDPERIDALFRQSGLYRPKWDQKHGGATYGRITIDKALASRVDFYGGRLPAAAPPAVNGNGNGNGHHAPAWLLPDRKRIWTTPELLSTDFPEPKWAVPGIVPVGLTYLAGRPKLGKSWLALQMAIAVGSGGRVFDEPIARGKVLYLALEDSERRIKERAQKQGIVATADITWATEWASLTDGGADTLLAALQAGAYSFVVIDTLSRFAGREDQQNLAAMTMALGSLQRMAMNLEVAVLMVDHHRKPGGLGADVIDDVMGSTGKAAVADAILGLYKQQGRAGAQLAITGRDLEERTLGLQFDPVTWCWQCLGDAGDVLRDTVKTDILVAIERLQELGELPTPTAIADLLGKKKQNVYAELVDLVNQGHVVKGAKQGKLQPYCLAGQTPEESEPEEEEDPVQESLWA